MKLTLTELRALVSEAVENSREVSEYLLESPELLDEASILKNKHPFKALYVLGPAGAGKTFISNKLLGVPKDFVVSNPDERIESVFPAFGMTMKYASHSKGEEASNLEKLQQTSREILQNAEQSHAANMLAIANPILFDTTGEEVEKIVGRMKALMQVGYDVALFQVNVPTEVSVDRDKTRLRTVGEPTKHISKEYQKQVAQDRGYFQQLAGIKTATILGGDIYANLFDLSSGEKLKGITDEHVQQMKTKDGSPYSVEYARSVMEQARNELQQWLGNREPINPNGKKVYAGMKKLVKLSGGKLGQNMNDLVAALANPELANDSLISDAAEHLASLGGADAALGKGQRGRKDAGTKQGTKGMGSGGKDTTIRGMTKQIGSGDTQRDASSDKQRSDKGLKKYEESTEKETALTRAIEDAILKVLQQ